MPLLTRVVPTPIVVDVRSGALDTLGRNLADQDISRAGRLAVVVTSGIGTRLRSRLVPQLPAASWFHVRDGSLDAALRLAEQLNGGAYDAVVGLGGGRVLDVAKYAAARVGLPMVAVATNLAHDGVASPVSVLDNESGRGSYRVPQPIAVVIDLAIVRRAPRRFVLAGIGEALSNLSAVADWELSARVTGEPVDGLAAAMARTAADALLYRTDGIDDDGFLTALADALVLSGMAMALATTSRPCSGACHEISHAIDLVFPDRVGLHGEQVGLGAAFAMYLRADLRRMTLLVDCLARHGLPIRPAQLGLTDQQFTCAVLRAPDTRPGRFTILEHLELNESGVREAVSAYLNALDEVRPWRGRFIA